MLAIAAAVIGGGESFAPLPVTEVNINDKIKTQTIICVKNKPIILLFAVCIFTW